MQQASPLQNAHPAQTVLAGMDGCRAGWISVHTTTGKDNQAAAPMADAAVSLFATIEEAVAAFGASTIIAVDMPIGLPEKTGAGGRGPEQAVRPQLGARQSSVFSIPSRSAVYAGTYGEACHLAQETSDPPRKVSKQAFNLFPKIHQLDRFLRCTKDDPAFAGITLYECHPEFAFAVLNHGTAMQLPKKIKSKVNPAGIAERRRLLERLGFDQEFLRHGIMGFKAADAALDDFIDACACLAVAWRVEQGLAHPHPEQYKRDAHGLPIAIWA
ncbi:DUF429 domain-containing protein [Salaquimonas pukyongi]|uniref:DUF429 domain-containing protein n=1 Tax=Salaquimonas pukyongi TaxID=2712698 RepID=UPI00096B6AC5|nr:DUF429 domain-containing protein [Salaquimonas pukyongi]